MQLSGSTAIITGGASGLGEATVRKFIAEGGKAAILDIQKDRGESLAKELGKDVMFVYTDITNDKSAEEAIKEVIKVFKKIHIAVNCAGVAHACKIYSNKKGPMPLDHFNNVIQINLVGTVNIIRLAVEQMLSNSPDEDGEKGVIVNTSSGAAFEGQIGQAAYSASKAGVVGMTLPLARECATYGVRIMTIAPGLFETPMISAMPKNVQESLYKMVPFPKRAGRPAEFAKLVKDIVENPMLNGEVIRLDGAMRMAAK